jgi:tetratricopeptide (TPR) repeat protein
MPCRFDRAEEAARRAVEYARRSDDERLVAGPLLLSIAASVLGTATPEEGLRRLEDVQTDLSRSRHLESFALLARATWVSMQGDAAEGRRILAVHDEIAQALGVRIDVAVNREQLGFMELDAGEAAAAERAFREYYEILDELGDEGHKSTAAANLARTLCELERFEEAETYAEIAVRIAAEDDLASQAMGRSARALVLAARGEFDEAERLARQAVELYAEAENPSAQADTWMDLAKVLRTARKAAEAEHAAREGLALYERKGNRPASASTRAFIDELS